MTITALPASPETNTGLRPTRSESEAHSGMTPMANRFATIAIQSIVVELMPMP